MKLSKWAKEQGICYRTAWIWFKEGKMPVKAEQLPSGAIMVYPETKVEQDDSCTIYCRVSSHNKKEDLERQRQRCEQFCIARGWKIEKQVCEVASGMNDRRQKLMKLLDAGPSRIVVENKDRLTRFGFNYIAFLAEKCGTEIIVINESDNDKDELMKDLISVITSFCCRFYGLRRGRAAAKSIKKQISES